MDISFHLGSFVRFTSSHALPELAAQPMQLARGGIDYATIPPAPEAIRLGVAKNAPPTRQRQSRADHKIRIDY